MGVLGNRWSPGPCRLGIENNIWERRRGLDERLIAIHPFLTSFAPACLLATKKDTFPPEEEPAVVATAFYHSLQSTYCSLVPPSTYLLAFPCPPFSDPLIARPSSFYLLELSLLCGARVLHPPPSNRPPGHYLRAWTNQSSEWSPLQPHALQHKACTHRN